MTNIKRVREITIEVEKVRVISNLKKEKSYCELCDLETEFILVNLASQVFMMTEEFLSQLANDKLIHLKFSAKNQIIVCLKSLLLARENL